MMMDCAKICNSVGAGYTQAVSRSLELCTCHEDLALPLRHFPGTETSIGPNAHQASASSYSSSSHRTWTMPKGNKSSASAGTRNKHAKKGSKLDEGASQASGSAGGQVKGSKKLTKAQKKLPKVKQYIPPPKAPAPAIPDPLDSQGLAHSLPPELVVVLRRIGKKDGVTKRKGLEELREGWVLPLLSPVSTEGVAREGDLELENEIRESSMVSAVPIWVSAT